MRTPAFESRRGVYLTTLSARPISVASCGVLGPLACMGSTTAKAPNMSLGPSRLRPLWRSSCIQSPAAALLHCFQQPSAQSLLLPRHIGGLRTVEQSGVSRRRQLHANVLRAHRPSLVPGPVDGWDVVPGPAWDVPQKWASSSFRQAFASRMHCRRFFNLFLVFWLTFFITVFITVFNIFVLYFNFIHYLFSL